ncbi:signal peptidase II [Modestobacter muralis]|uniref:hypothetical protein n=1 Tax=Modestobacter muralis TaxID=1608614 RepID=UPI001B8C1165|nr:hypothetical protein [Modestobacter muralis]
MTTDPGPVVTPDQPRRGRPGVVRLGLGAAVLVLAGADLAVKEIAEDSLSAGESVDVGLLALRLGYNPVQGSASGRTCPAES